MNFKQFLNFIYESETEVKLMLNENGKLIDFKIIDLINMLKMQYNSSSEFKVPSNNMKLVNSSKNFDIKIDIRNLELQVNQNKIERIVGDIYLKRK